MTRALEEAIPAWVDGRLQPVEKLEAHRLVLRHKAISIFVNRGECTLLQKLGIAADRLERRGHVVYRADVGNGLVEHEEVDVFTLELPQADLPSPDPAEVAKTRWITYADLEAALAAEPQAFTPWLRIYLTEYRSLILAAE